LHFVLAYGAWWVPAAIGWRALWRRAPRLALFAGGWVVAAPLLAYLPIPTQRRLVEAVQLPLAGLAVVGLSTLPPRWRRPGVAALLAVALPTALLLWLGALGAARGVAEPVFHPPDQMQAFEWLRANAAPGAGGLSTYETGNVLPAFTPLRAYVGHGPETIHLEAKLPRVAAFFAAATSDEQRRQLLAEGHVQYVIWGPAERALGDFDPRRAAYLRVVYQAGDTYVLEALP
jgi:hypothetical protein